MWVFTQQLEKYEHIIWKYHFTEFEVITFLFFLLFYNWLKLNVINKWPLVQSSIYYVSKL